MAPTNTEVMARVDKIERRLEAFSERAIATEGDMRLYKRLFYAGLVMAGVCVAIFGFQLFNASAEVTKVVKEELQKSLIGQSRASVQEAAADAKKMRDSVAESLASAKEVLEQAEKGRKMSVVSLDGIQGAAPGDTYTILRFKEGASGLAIISVSTRFLPSVTSFVVPYCHYDHSKASPIYKDTEAIHSNFSEFTGQKATGVLVLGAFGLSLDAVIQNQEIRLLYRHNENDLTKAVHGVEREFFVDVKVLLISDGPMPEVLTDIEKARVVVDYNMSPKKPVAPPATPSPDGKSEDKMMPVVPK